MSTIEEGIKEMNLHRVKKKVDESSSQQYEPEIIVPYKNNKTLLFKKDAIDLYDEGGNQQSPRSHPHLLWSNVR